MRKNNKKKYLIQEKHSSYSPVDPFLKIESLFLQKFFRYNLQDYFEGIFSHNENNFDLGRSNSKELQLLQSLTFRLKADLNVQQLSSKVNQFYHSSNQQGQVSFKYLYSNCSRKQLLANEKVMIWVKMRCDSQSLKNLPSHIQEQLSKYSNTLYRSQQQKKKMYNLSNDSQKAINLLIVYFGDINFHIFDKKNYQLKTMKLFGRVSPVNIHVFYVSRIALINKFKEINKINQLDTLNDLLIQFYEAKRQKTRKKRRKHLAMAQQVSNSNEGNHTRNILKWTLLFSIGGITILFLKLVC